ncbi:MAG: fused MFS/spermidine synthase [Pseudomonadota bacterium]
MAYFLFFITGLCSLVYEVVWSRMLVLVMGNTTAAASGILASFMAGLSLGSYYWGKFSEKHPEQALAAFGWLRLGIGFYGLVFPWLFGFLIPLDVWLSREAGSIVWPRLAAAGPALLVPTFLMGGTLALLGRRFINEPESFGRKAALFYGLDGVGAVSGALLAGFFLIQYLGHAGALVLAGVVNLLVGAGAVLAARRFPYVESRPAPTKRKKRKNAERTAAGGRGAAGAVLLGLAVSGFTAMGYQVFWTRLLIPVVDNSVYSFSLVLSFFLGGLALGGLLLAPLQKYIAKPAMFYGLSQVLIGASAFLFPFFVKFSRGDWSTPYILFLLEKLPWAILIPAVVMGAAFPLAARVLQEGKGEVGRGLGTAFSFSTGGGVLGALAAGLVLIPSWGYYRTALLLPALNLAAGGVILALTFRPLLAAASLGMLAALGLAGGRLMPPDYFFNKCSEMEPASRLAFYHEGRSATAAVLERPDRTKVLYFNGMPEVDDSSLSLSTFKIMGILPGLLTENNRSVLMVCFGAGVTSAAAATYADRVSAVDLVEAVPQIAGIFSDTSGNVAENPKFDLTIDDARHFLHQTNRKYDIIVSDSTHPRAYDSWVLYTREFYETVRPRLTESGTFAQWVPFHGLDPSQFISIIKTFSQVFPHASLWSLGGAYAFLLAGPQTLNIDFEEFYRRMSQPEIRRELRPLGLDDPFVLLSHFEMGEAGIRGLVGDAGRIITDNSPSQLFFSPLATLNEQYRDWPEANRRALASRRESIAPYLTNLGRTEAERAALIERMVLEEKSRSRRDGAP